MSKVLVTGGAGYIGSHTVVDLYNHGFEVIIADDLSRSDGTALTGIQEISGEEITFYQIDLCDKHVARTIFEQHPDLAGIIHFAAFKSVPESVKMPLAYFRNNLVSLMNMLEYAREFKIKAFIFSSSCSVYGNADSLPVTENSPLKNAESPYARTKQMGEEMVRDVITFREQSSHPDAILLRYFNPVGAHESAKIGELPVGKPENLVPYITQTAIGIREKLTIYGDDYPTRDGTCIRDYIHVMDIANAHTRALKYVLDGKNKTSCEVFNLGTGNGVTVKEVVDTFEKVTGISLNYNIGRRRAGDVIAVFANNEKAAKALHWKPVRSLAEMMRSAWEWEKYYRRKDDQK